MRDAGSANIAVATSIPPKLSRRNAGRTVDGEYQDLCIRSALECGFRVLSINDAQEIPDLSVRYPDVNFIQCSRNASALSGRKNPYIADMLRALIAQPEPVLGIINSDIVFEPSGIWNHRMSELVTNAVITGRRYDATSLLDGTFRRYYWGFDYFFFTPQTAKALVADADPFAMGLPWWDYWLPLCASINGCATRVLERPAIAHLIHKEPSVDDMWRELGLTLARFVLRVAFDYQSPLSGSLVPLCKLLVERADIAATGALDAQISDLAVKFVPEVTRDVIDVTPQDLIIPSNGAGLTPRNTFLRFEDRLRAGEMLEYGKHHESQGQSNEAEPLFEEAWKTCPDDFDVLLTIGKHLIGRRNIQPAITFLSRAAEQQPDSCAVLNSLAAALRAAGRYNEAVARLHQAMQSDPADRPSYLNLALTLYESGRPQQAIHCLESALAKWPGFSDATELYERFIRFHRPN